MKGMTSTPYRLIKKVHWHWSYYSIFSMNLVRKSRVAGEHVKASTKRSSKVCYLSDGDSRLSEMLSERIGDVTGLKIKIYKGLSRNSEDLQVLF